MWPFNIHTWEKRIQRAERKGYFSASDLRRAHRWNSCAVGERAHALHRDISDATSLVQRQFGEQITRLGLEFDYFVTKQKVERARKRYDEIQKLLPTYHERLAKVCATSPAVIEAERIVEAVK